MTAPGDLTALVDATWPPARRETCGPFQVNLSPGGGKRVTAAVLDGGVATPADLDAADAAMRQAGQTPLYRVLPGQEALDTALAGRGFARVDDTVLCSAPLAPLLAIERPRVSVFDIWPPLAIMDEIWEHAGIGADRRAVMDRCTCPHAGLMGRVEDRAAGVGFVALQGATAMVHALETVPQFRRKGVARRMMGQAAVWANRHGADRLSVLVTAANTDARAFYAALGMTETGGYHYRIKLKEEAHG